MDEHTTGGTPNVTMCDCCGRDFHHAAFEKFCTYCGYNNGPGWWPRRQYVRNAGFEADRVASGETVKGRKI